MIEQDHRRADTLLSAAARIGTRGLHGFDDDELLGLLAEHRWAVGRLSSPHIPMALRTKLNAAVLKTHGALHRRAARRGHSVGAALRLIKRPLLITAAVFFGSMIVAASAVLADPVLAYALAPRTFLAQIDADAWGDRGGAAANVGMTFFYWGNNLRASFLALGLGVLGGVPSQLVIALNGALLGVAAAIAVMRGVGDRLLAWIAPHGVPEIGAVLLCGAMGMVLGRSWLQPGSRLRRSALAEAGRRMTPLIVVAAVLVILAAPLEGFVAPMDLPWWLDLSIPLGWVVVLGYGARRALSRARL